MAFREKFRSFVTASKPEIPTEPEIKIELTDLVETEVVASIEKTEETIDETKSELQKEVLSTFIEKEEKAEEQIKVEEKTINEKEEFNSLDLSKDDILSLKRLAFADILQEDITISELVDLVLLAKSNKTIKSKNKDSLFIREYIDRVGKITAKGKVYLEEDTTKNRLRDILQ